MRYKITVKQLVPDSELDLDDLNTRPDGTYYSDESDRDAALDEFHASIAISCLDHYSIDIELTDD